jgi:hypothetical protein
MLPGSTHQRSMMRLTIDHRIARRSSYGRTGIWGGGNCGRRQNVAVGKPACLDDFGRPLGCPHRGPICRVPRRSRTSRRLAWALPLPYLQLHVSLAWKLWKTSKRENLAKLGEKVAVTEADNAISDWWISGRGRNNCAPDDYHRPEFTCRQWK